MGTITDLAMWRAAKLGRTLEPVPVVSEPQAIRCRVDEAVECVAELERMGETILAQRFRKAMAESEDGEWVAFTPYRLTTQAAHMIERVLERMA